MKGLVKTAKHALLMLRISSVDRRYIQLNRDIDWYEQALKDNQKMAYRSRRTLLDQRSWLRNELRKLETQ